MQYASPAAFRAGLEARLLNQSREAGVDLGRLRRGVVFDRLLSRLARSGDGEWVLKGGMALEVRMGNRARATRDLDLALRGAVPEDAAGEWMRSALVEALATGATRPGHGLRIVFLALRRFGALRVRSHNLRPRWSLFSRIQMS